MKSSKSQNRENIIDILNKFKRGPQIITQKDAGTIISQTGLKSGMRCLDAGGGSGFMTIMIANIIAPEGKIYAYEINPEFARVVKHNVKLCGLEDIVIVKNKPAEKFTEKNLDLITLDMKGSEGIVTKAYAALKKGGFLCIYSPHIEQQKAAAENMIKAGFHRLKTVENIQREWQLGTHSHPHPSGVIHTGFITVGRKV